MLEREFFVSAGDDGCKNKPVGEDDSVGEQTCWRDCSEGKYSVGRDTSLRF